MIVRESDDHRADHEVKATCRAQVSREKVY